MWGHPVKGPVQKQRLPLLKEQYAFLLCESSCAFLPRTSSLCKGDCISFHNKSVLSVGSRGWEGRIVPGLFAWCAVGCLFSVSLHLVCVCVYVQISCY